MIKIVDMTERLKKAEEVKKMADINAVITAIVSGEQLQQTAAARTKYVRNQGEALHLIKEKVLRRNGKGINCTLLYIDKQGNVCPKLQPQDWGRLAEFLQNGDFLETTKMTVGWEKRKRVKRFTRSFLMVSVEDISGLGFLYNAPVFNEDGSKLIKAATYKAIYRSIAPDGKDRFWMRINRKGKGYMIAISDPGEQEVISIEEWQSSLVAEHGYYVYDGAWGSCSPGELKGHTVRLPGRYVGPEVNRKVDWAQFYHELTSGAWTEWCKNGGSLDWAAIGEFNSRCTLGNAYHKRLDTCPIRSYALYCGKFKDASGYEYMDGLTLMLADYFAKALTAECQGEIIFSEEVVKYLLAQVRPFLINKVTSLSVTKGLMRGFINRLAAERVNFIASEMTEDQQRAWCSVADKSRRKNKQLTTCKIDGKTVDLNKKLVFVYWDEDTYNEVSEYQTKLLAGEAAEEPAGWLPDFLTDLNGQKTYFYPWEFESGLNMLSIAHPDNGKAVLSTQVLTSYAANDFDKTMDMLNILSSMEIDKAREKLFTTEGTPISWMDLQSRTEVETDTETGSEIIVTKTPNYSDIISQIAPAFSFEQCAIAWRRRVNQALKKLSKMFERLNIPVDGTHTVILPDLAKIICGVDVLGVNSKGVHEIYSAQNNASTINGDDYIDKFLQIVEEQNLNISDELKEEFISAIKGLSTGISVVPANEITARANEGWDFDGDSMYTFKMDKGYKKADDHFVWCTDSAEGRVTLGHINRYPKTHPYGYMRCLENTWLRDPYGVCIEE